MTAERGDELIADQIAYYRARAPEYDRTFRGAHEPGLVARLRAAAPRGDVLELACGSGAWTQSLLAEPVGSILCIDAAPEMLALHARRIRDARVTRAVGDLFRWRPTARYDVVTFAFWVSHVPPGRFAHFWSRVADGLHPGGRVLFADQDARAAGWERTSDDADYPSVERVLEDGRTMRAIKVYHDASALQAALRDLGWKAMVEPVGDGFLWGEASRS